MKDLANVVMTKMNQCHFEIDDALPFVCICTLFSFLCGVGIGGNDLSANFAMVVGSGSLNMKQAIIYCTVFEILGCVFMGAHVSGMIRNGIADPAVYAISPEATIIGMVSASFAAAMWLFASAVWGLPVSITHTVVGSILGFAVFSQGSFEYVQYSGIVLVMLSWITAPLLSAFTAAGFFAVLRAKVMNVKRPMKAAEAALPFCLGTSLFIELVFVFIGRPPILDSLALILPLRTAFVAGMAIIAFVCVYAKEYVFPAVVFESMTMETFPWDSATLVTTGKDSDDNSPTSVTSEDDKPIIDATIGELPMIMERQKSLRRAPSMKRAAEEASPALAGNEEQSKRLTRRTSVMRMSPLSTQDSKISASREVRMVPALTRRESLLTKNRMGLKREEALPTAPESVAASVRTTMPTREDDGTSPGTSPPQDLPRKGTGVFTHGNGGEEELVAVNNQSAHQKSDSHSDSSEGNRSGSKAHDAAFGMWSYSFPSESVPRPEEHSPNKTRRPPPIKLPKSPRKGDPSPPESAVLVGASLDNRTKEEKEMGVVVYKIGDTSEEDERDERDGDAGGEISGGGQRFHRRAEYLFTILQVVAGAASSFVHGAVAGANATAPFVVLYQSFSQHFLQHPSTLPSGWVSFPASMGIAVGMYSLGTKLMKTVGLELVTVTPVRGWSIQVGGTVITMICTGIGIPVSLSQCQVGAAIGVGIVDGGIHRVAWKTVLKIIAGWLVTLFVAATTTGMFMRILTHTYC